MRAAHLAAPLVPAEIVLVKAAAALHEVEQHRVDLILQQAGRGAGGGEQTARGHSGGRDQASGRQAANLAHDRKLKTSAGLPFVRFGPMCHRIGGIDADGPS